MHWSEPQDLKGMAFRFTAFCRKDKNEEEKSGARQPGQYTNWVMMSGAAARVPHSMVFSRAGALPASRADVQLHSATDLRHS